MKPAPFEYHAPNTLDQATGLPALEDEDFKVFAGGHRLVPLTNLRLARSAHLVDVIRIRIPEPPAGSGRRFVEFARKTGDYAVVAAGAIVRVALDARSRTPAWHTPADSIPVRLTAAEVAYVGWD